LAGLPKKYAKMGFKVGWKKFKASKKTRSKPTKRKVKPVAKRKRARAAPKRRRVGRKIKHISIIGDVAPLGWSYTCISGNQIGEVIDRAMKAVMDGQGDVAEILMEEVVQTINNVTANPVKIGLRLGIGVGALKYASHLVGRRKIFRVGKYQLDT